MQPGDLIAERFEVEALAGAGGMGAVYRARDRHTGQPVALKTLLSPDEDHARRFLREVAVLYELNHPRIVRYVAHGRTAAGELYMGMEWLAGESVADRIKRQVLSIQDAIVVVTAAAEAIAYAHGRGVIHRDIKPGNLFLLGGAVDRVKVLDFGLARMLASNEALTRTGAMLGTPGYMAPEQAQGARSIGPATDVYALGCVLFRCITGRIVFQAEEVLALLAKLVLEDPPRLSSIHPHVPPDLDELVFRMLARDVKRRPQDGEALLAELRALGAAPAAPGLLELPSGSLSPLSITGSERRVVCFVLARRGAALGEDMPTRIADADADALRDLRVGLGRFGGQLTQLIDGSLLVTVGTGAASDQAFRAARCALLLHEAMEHTPVALVAGRGLQSPSGLPIGEAIDRAAELLALRTTDAVRLNPVAAALLGESFPVGRDEAGFVLRGQRGDGTDDRVVLLLGRPTKIVGRARELRTLEATIDECVAEPVARAVLVTGNAGMGKSRLRHEFLRKLEQRSASLAADGDERKPAVWIARGDPMSAGAAFSMVAPILRRAIGALPSDGAAVVRAKLRARIAERVAPTDRARIEEFLGVLIGADLGEEQSVQLRAARQEPMLMGDQLRRAWEDWIAAECAAHPVLIVLEDLHLGDLPSVQFLEAALRHAHDQPLMVLALARPELHELFPKIWQQRDVQEIRLAPLTRKASLELVHQVLGPDVAAGLADRLVDQAGGHAFFLEELIRSAAEGRADELPETVLAMVQARLEALEPPARRILRAGSIFGQAFWKQGVVALVGEPPELLDFDHWLADLVARELVIPRSESQFAGTDEYVFRNALVREASYAMLTDEDRMLGHRLARPWLEQAGESSPLVLAEHCERAGEPAAAAPLYQRAAEHALEGNDLEAVLSRAARALACGATGESAGQLSLLQATAHRWRGEFAAMQSAADLALAALTPGSPAWCAAAAELAVASRALGQHDRVVTVARALNRHTPATAVRSAYAKAAARVAMQLFLSGKTEPGDQLLWRIDEVAPAGELGALDPTAVAWCHQARAFEALYAGDPGGYLTESAAAAGWYGRAGDLRSVCNSQVHLGFAYLSVGAYPEAEQALREAHAAAERMGLHNVVATAKNNLGLALARLGRLTEAEAMEREAIALAASQGTARLEGGSHHYLALIMLLGGRLDEAEQEAARAAELLAISPPLRAHALATVAAIKLRQGQASAALEPAREAMEILGKLDGIEEGESSVRRVYVEALHALGHDAEAAQALTEARDRLLARAAKIRDEGWRRSFLERVPENAKTFEPLPG